MGVDTVEIMGATFDRELLQNRKTSPGSDNFYLEGLAVGHLSDVPDLFGGVALSATVWKNRTFSRSETTTPTVGIDSRHGGAIRLFMIEPSDHPSGPAPALVEIYVGFSVTTPHYSPQATACTEKGGICVEVDFRVRRSK